MLALVRHGRTPWNDRRLFQGRSDIALDAAGREQISALALQLRDTAEWARIVSSPLTRARQSAEILAEALGLEAPTRVANLIERDFGVAEGQPVDDMFARWPDGEFPDAEPWPVLRKRAALALAREYDRAEKSPTIVVAHGVFLRAGISTLTGTEWPRLLNAEAVLLRRTRSGAYQACAVPQAHDTNGSCLDVTSSLGI
ncbi:histidine phosphatase family protein [Microbacterium sp. YY-03]|uniref:histidine phosphatase family protein n=1 Tax=Microbacterium sp. YY-03 TaxID=3421636 RepID=UPI003D17C31F